MIASVSMTAAGLSSSDDRQHVKTFEQKLQLIRDRVASVAHGYHTACYLVGRPGTSKTSTVREELDRLSIPWAYQNARMTPMGLFGFIAEHSEHAVVLDDIPSLLKNDQAVQILLAALDGEPRKPRVVSYKSKDEATKVLFTGAIIAISNVPLRCDPLARALGSRLVVLEHEPTDEEIAAFVRQLSSKGFEDLSADECLEVSEFVIVETREFDLRLDLRHMKKAWQDYRQWKHKKAKTHWRDLVRTSLSKLVDEPVVPLSKRDEIELQRQKVKEAMEKHPHDRHAQIAASGLKPSTFYNRLKEVMAGMSP
ncbi:MAG TPA: hypothetical protein VHC22_32405 [Pirellulales bacterium]|nr:hypothetical protein [Pirellulales bacterium]